MMQAVSKHGAGIRILQITEQTVFWTYTGQHFLPESIDKLWWESFGTFKEKVSTKETFRAKLHPESLKSLLDVLG